MQKPVIFYDGGCPLCRREIQHYWRLDLDGRIEWLDVADPTVSLERFGLARQSTLQRLHAIDERGGVQVGVPAFLTIWRALPGYRWLAAAIVGLRLTGVLDVLYRRFADWRYGRRCKEGCDLGGRQP